MWHCAPKSVQGVTFIRIRSLPSPGAARHPQPTDPICHSNHTLCSMRVPLYPFYPVERDIQWLGAPMTSSSPAKQASHRLRSPRQPSIAELGRRRRRATLSASPRSRTPDSGSAVFHAHGLPRTTIASGFPEASLSSPPQPGKRSPTQGNPVGSVQHPFSYHRQASEPARCSLPGRVTAPPSARKQGRRWRFRREPRGPYAFNKRLPRYFAENNHRLCVSLSAATAPVRIIKPDGRFRPHSTT
jgi:hypothetical protein